MKLSSINQAYRIGSACGLIVGIISGTVYSAEASIFAVIAMSFWTLVLINPLLFFGVNASLRGQTIVKPKLKIALSLVMALVASIVLMPTIGLVIGSAPGIGIVIMALVSAIIYALCFRIAFAIINSIVK